MSKKLSAPKNGDKIYEIGYHIISSIAEENVPAEVEKIKVLLKGEKAEVIAEEAPKLRPLAYAIKKAFGGTYKTFDKAYFGWVKFALGESGDVTKVGSALKNNENILRYIVIKTIRENTMYSPKITVFSDKEAKIKNIIVKEEKDAKPASIEDIDKSIDKLVADEVKI